jgi:hypothetical protein
METTIRTSGAEWARVGEDATDTMKHVLDLHGQGVGWKAIKRLTGVGYSPAWLFVTRSQYLAEGGLISLDSVAAAKPIVAARRAEGDSWGRIAARCGVPEGQVRRLFTEATNVDHQGLRNGHGGRFLQNNAEAYAPAPKVGWVRPQAEGTPLPEFILAGLLKAGAIESADVEEIQAMSLNDLRKMAKSLSLPTAGTKKDLVARIAQAYAA